MTSHTGGLAIWGVVAIAIIIAGFSAYKTRDSWRLRRTIKNATAASPGSIRAGQGPVELSGQAQAAEHTFTSPLTRQECVAYRFVKKERQRRHNNAHDNINLGDDDDHHNDNQPEYEWVTIHEEEGGAPFYVDDGAGRTLVDGATADLDIEKSYEVDTDEVSQGIGEKIIASVKGLAGGGGDEESHEIPEEYVDEIRNAGNQRRYYEWVVHEGEEVYVYGEAVSPDQTPMGSGGFDVAAGAMTGPESGSVLDAIKGILGMGVDAATNPTTRYKLRALQRLPDPEIDEEQSKKRAEQMREQAQQITDGMESTMTGREADESLADRASQMVEQASRIQSESMPDVPAIEGATSVVSWGQKAPTFVISDQGKGSVVRNFSTSVVKYAALTLLFVGVAAGAVAFALGLV